MQRRAGTKAWRSALGRIHSWAGAVLAAFLLIIALTGIGLAFLGELLRWQFPQVVTARASLQPAVTEDIDALLRTARQGFGAPIEIGALYMPNTRLPVNSILLVGVAAGAPHDDGPIVMGIDPGSGDYLGSFALNDAWAYQLANLHFQLLAGESGEALVALLAAASIAFSVILGVVIWWPPGGSPLRKALRMRLAGPVPLKLFRLHGLTGIWMAAILALWLFTGIHEAKPDWFGGFVRDSPPPPLPLDATTCGQSISAGEAVDAAAMEFPSRSLAYLYLQSDADAYYYATFRGPHDTNRHQGDGSAWMHKRCRGVVHASVIQAQPPPARIANALYSLHSGRSFGAAGKPLVLSCGLALTMMSLTGLISWWTRTLQRRA